MPRKKKEPRSQPTPPAPVRPIQCAFCQKELDPQTDEVTFIGMGRWRDGPGLFHAVCSAKTPDNEDNPCLQNGLAWAKKFTSREPVLFTYEQWKARPVRRRVSAFRAAKGRYELQLTESHLHCIFFLDTKHAPNAEKAKEVVNQWQTQWNISPEDSPNVDEIETKARIRPQPSASSLANLETLLSKEKRVELPSELQAEIDRHCKTHSRHLRNHILTDGDNCKSCKISRGIKKLFLYTTCGPLLDSYRETGEELSRLPFAAGNLANECLSSLKSLKKTLFDGLNLKDNDDKHNEEAMKRNFAEMKLVIEMMAKYGIKSEAADQTEMPVAEKRKQTPQSTS